MPSSLTKQLRETRDDARRAESVKPDTRLAVVYVIQCAIDERGPVKIGHAADPEWRLANLQSGNPWPLVLLAASPQLSKTAAIDIEEQLHEEFQHLRIRGEWFRWSEEIATLPGRLVKK